MVSCSVLREHRNAGFLIETACWWNVEKSELELDQIGRGNAGSTHGVYVDNLVVFSWR